MSAEGRDTSRLIGRDEVQGGRHTVPWMLMQMNNCLTVHAKLTASNLDSFAEAAAMTSSTIYTH